MKIMKKVLKVEKVQKRKSDISILRVRYPDLLKFHIEHTKWRTIMERQGNFPELKT